MCFAVSKIRTIFQSENLSHSNFFSNIILTHYRFAVWGFPFHQFKLISVIYINRISFWIIYRITRALWWWSDAACKIRWEVPDIFVIDWNIIHQTIGSIRRIGKFCTVCKNQIPFTNISVFVSGKHLCSCPNLQKLLVIVDTYFSIYIIWIYFFQCVRCVFVIHNCFFFICKSLIFRIVEFFCHLRTNICIWLWFAFKRIRNITFCDIRCFRCITAETILLRYICNFTIGLHIHSFWIFIIRNYDLRR